MKINTSIREFKSCIQFTITDDKSNKIASITLYIPDTNYQSRDEAKIMAAGYTNLLNQLNDSSQLKLFQGRASNG